MSDWKERLGMVYSTNPDFQYTTSEQEETTTLSPEKQNLRVWLDRKQRGGKVVTLVKGFVGTEADLAELKDTFRLFAFDILGLKEERGSDSGREEAFGKVVDMLLQQRQVAKANKDWATSDKIRDELAALGFEIKDGKEGATWKLNR